MRFFNFGGKKTRDKKTQDKRTQDNTVQSNMAQNKRYEELLDLGVKSYQHDAYERAVGYFDQAMELKASSYENTHSDAERSALCNLLLLRGRSLFMMEQLQRAYQDFLRICELLGDIPVQQSNLDDCKLLRQACEFGAAAAEQTGDAVRQRELLIRHLDICKKIFETTEMAEDYKELGDSYDYQINISESYDEKIFHAEKMKEVFQNLHKQLPDHAYISERLDYAYEALADQLKEKIDDALKREDYSLAASGYERLTNVKMEHTLGKKEVRYEDLDEDAEFFHKAAQNYQKAGDTASATRCLKSAIQLRATIAKVTDSDIARARLCYSYVMAITTVPSLDQRAEYAKLAYDMLSELEKKHPEESNFKKMKELALSFLD